MVEETVRVGGYTVAKDGNTYYGVGCHEVVDLRKPDGRTGRFICRKCRSSHQTLVGLLDQSCNQAA